MALVFIRFRCFPTTECLTCHQLTFWATALAMNSSTVLGRVAYLLLFPANFLSQKYGVKSFRCISESDFEFISFTNCVALSVQETCPGLSSMEPGYEEWQGKGSRTYCVQQLQTVWLNAKWCLVARFFTFCLVYRIPRRGSVVESALAMISLFYVSH